MLERLAQITIENEYSKSNIRDKIMTDLVKLDNNEFGDKIDKACGYIQEYLRGEYWPSKHLRITQLYESDIDIDQIVYEILAIILPVQGIQTIQSVCGQLAGKLGFNDIFDGITTAGELIAVVCKADLYNVILPEASITGSALIENTYELSDELMQYISNTKYLPPMICAPKTINSNYQCANLTIKDSVILKNKTHDGKQSLDVINIRNQIALSIDLKILELEETPKHELDTEKKELSFNRMRDSSSSVYEALIEEGNMFYLTHKVDERGRMYCQGYHCSYQSSQYKKALINLHKKELIV